MDKTRAQILGENLKRIRQLKGYSRKDLADVIGITEIAFGTYERGIRLAPLDKIFELAEFLDVTIADLTGENPNVENKRFFEYRYKRAIQITSVDFLHPTTESDDGKINLYIPAKVVRDKDGTLTFCADESGLIGDYVTFRDKQVFVEVIEHAELFAAKNYMPLYQVLRNEIAKNFG